MPRDSSSPDEDSAQANMELDHGLKNCRSMLNDYRALLTTQGPIAGATASNENEAEWRTQEDSNL